MAITASQVKELRDKTGSGMMDCKKALIEADGDLEKAIEILRKKGASVAAKRADRDANEGIILTKILDDGKTGVILEINCETDFVANSDDFVNFSNFILDVVAANRPANLEELISSELGGKKVETELSSIVGKIGEKIEISRFVLETTENGKYIDYIHAGAKLGVLLRVENAVEVDSEKLDAVFKDIAMQTAAMRPLFLKSNDVPAEVIEKEKDIYKEVLRKEGKPEQMLDKIAEGKINKYFKEVCLIEQAYVKDNSKAIKDVITDFNKDNSTDVSLTAFFRYHTLDEQK